MATTDWMAKLGTVHPGDLQETSADELKQLDEIVRRPGQGIGGENPARAVLLHSALCLARDSDNKEIVFDEKHKMLVSVAIDACHQLEAVALHPEELKEIVDFRTQLESVAKTPVNDGAS